MAASKISLDKDAFFRRIKRIYDAWKVKIWGSYVGQWSRCISSRLCLFNSFDALREFQKEETTEDNGTNFPSVDAVVIAVGQDEDVIYSKSTAIQVK